MMLQLIMTGIARVIEAITVVPIIYNWQESLWRDDVWSRIRVFRYHSCDKRPQGTVSVCCYVRRRKKSCSHCLATKISIRSL